MAARLVGERLPPQWSYGVTSDGRIFFIHDQSRETTWLHPLTGEPVQTGYSTLQDLPQGWEQALTIDGTVYFIDHNRHFTTFEHPISGHPIMNPPNRTPPQSPISKGSRKSSGKGRPIKAPVASRGENSKVIMRGWLQKQESGTLKLWKKKWCVLADFGLFFYKDNMEQSCIGSLLLPSYSINPCGHSDVNKKFAFKAEHENMKTFYFATENQVEMNKWVEALRMASLVQRAPGAGTEKLIPKNPIMRWNDDMESPGVAPPDMPQYPFSGQSGPGTPAGSDMDGSFRSDRHPFQPRENIPNYQDPYCDESFRSDNGGQGYGHQGYPPQQVPYDPRYPGERVDSVKGSQRSSRSHPLPDDQRSMSNMSQRSNQPSFSTLPRDMRPNHLDISMRSQGSSRGQGYNSLPRNSRSNLSPGDSPDRPYGHSSPRQPVAGQRRKDDNPYMTMSPQMNSDRKMDPLKHSNRPLPQEPIQQPIHERGRSGGGDYASLTRIREKWPNQQLSDSHDESVERMEVQQVSTQHLSPSQLQNPHLYVDIPHTYVNVYDSSQLRDNAPDLPSRPPLPSEMRKQIVQDIAQSHSPNTQRDLIMAETNLEQRMKQPAYFSYPTPVLESQPGFPQDSSPRSQYSQRSQRSQTTLPGQPDVDRNMTNRGNHGNPPHDTSYGERYNIATLSSSHLNDSNMTLTNEEERNDKISEFYGLGKYNTKNRVYDPRMEKSRFRSDMDVRANNPVSSKPITGVTGENDFRLRSLPDHVQSMPALYHEQVANERKQQPTTSYANLAPAPPVQNGDDTPERRSAFRPLSSSGSNSLQRIPSQDTMPGYQKTPPEDSRTASKYLDPQQTEVKRMSSASSHTSQQPYSSWRQDKPQGPEYSQGQGRSQGHHQGQGHQQGYPNQGQPQGQGKGQSHRNPRMAQPIQTVREEPDMPDSQVIETDLPRRVFPLNGPRLRMSISATDLLGKTHDELVLLLIQLRRDKAELNEQRDGLRKTIEQHRPAEFYYRKLQNEDRPIDGEKEVQHRKYVDLKRKLEDIEKRLEVYKPLVNLVCNMVTMGSLYGGDNLMLATEYRKHLLSPDQYSPPKKMIEFSRRNQEDQIMKEMEEDVKQLTQEQADLQEKIDRIYQLDRDIQEQSFQVTSLKEDREMLERALGGLLKKQDQHCADPQQLDTLVNRQRTIEHELSRVLQQLAEASKELEEATAENNRLEHEVSLLRSKVHGNVHRSKSAPSLSSESMRTKVKMEKDLAKVKNIMVGLSQEGARLQEMMTNLRKPRPFTESLNTAGGPMMPNWAIVSPGSDTKKKDGGTYFETDLDSMVSKDLSTVTALLASYQLVPGQGSLSPEPLTHWTDVALLRSPPPDGTEGSSAFRTVSPSDKEPEPMFHDLPIQPTFQQSTQAPLEASMEGNGSEDQWDIGEADDNTKRFYGLIPKGLQKQTVRDVKRNSESRRKKEDDPPPLRVGVIPSDYNDSNQPVYENLPQQKSAPPTEADTKLPGLQTADGITSTGPPRRRSNLHLMTPKPFSLNSKPTPYSSVQSLTSTSYHNQALDQSDASLHNHNTQISQSQPSLDSSNVESNQSNDTYKPTEPMKTQITTKTPPPPPVRGTSKNFKDLFTNTQTNRNFDPPVPAILRKGRNSQNKDRYMTISSSQPLKLETTSPQSPKISSQAGDLFTSMDVPDIVKSSTTKPDNYDERTIDREILFFPEKVDIPERYIPDSDDESVTEEEKAHRQEKANKIKRILAQQSVHSLSQPDVSKVAGEVHERIQMEKQKRELLLGINQELAEQVKRKSRQYAAERRKTWSGSMQKQETNPDSQHAETDDEYHGDTNNNSFGSPGGIDTTCPSYTSPANSHSRYNSYTTTDHYNPNEYTSGENHSYSREDNSYREEYSREDNLYSREEYSRADNSDYYDWRDNSDMYSGNNGDIYGVDSAGRPKYLDEMYSSALFNNRPNFSI